MYMNYLSLLAAIVLTYRPIHRASGSDTLAQIQQIYFIVDPQADFRMDS